VYAYRQLELDFEVENLGKENELYCTYLSAGFGTIPAMEVVENGCL
jgi:hypothetical protein